MTYKPTFVMGKDMNGRIYSGAGTPGWGKVKNYLQFKPEYNPEEVRAALESGKLWIVPKALDYLRRKLAKDVGFETVEFDVAFKHTEEIRKVARAYEEQHGVSLLPKKRDSEFSPVAFRLKALGLLLRS